MWLIAMCLVVLIEMLLLMYTLVWCKYIVVLLLIVR